MKTLHLDEEDSVLYFQENFINLNKDELDDLWNLCPDNYHTIRVFGKTVKIPRFQQAYGKSYEYSGNIIKGKETPIIIDKIKKEIEKIFPYNFNNCLANWYLNSEHYIGFHSDNTKPFIDGSPIVGITFCEGNPRKLVIKNKNNIQVVMIKTLNNSMYAMTGKKFQKKFKHGIPKQKNCGKRLSLTFRAFKN